MFVEFLMPFKSGSAFTADKWLAQVMTGQHVTSQVPLVRVTVGTHWAHKQQVPPGSLQHASVHKLEFLCIHSKTQLD